MPSQRRSRKWRGRLASARRALRRGHRIAHKLRRSWIVLLIAILVPVDLALWELLRPEFNRSLTIFLDARYADLPNPRWQDVFLSSWDWTGPLRNGFLAGMVPAFLLWMDRCWRKGKGFVGPMTALAGVITLQWLPVELVRHLPALNPSLTGARTSNIPQWTYMALVLGGLASLPFWARVLRRLSRLDRYMVQSFLAPLAVCLAAFLGIWLVIDFSGNVAEFTAGNAGLRVIFGYYLQQLPQILVTLLPIAVLLAVLYTLSRMSRFNELTAMLSAGRGLLRLLAPLFVAAGLLSLFTLVLNFRLAPHALAQKKAALEAIAAGAEPDQHLYAFTDRQYVDPDTRRIWFLGRFPANYTPGDIIRAVYVVQLDNFNTARRAIYSDAARWYPLTQDAQGRQSMWRFDRATVWELQKDGRFLLQSFTGDQAFYAYDWSENPYLLGTAGLKPADAGVPEIVTYLRSTANASPERSQPWLLALQRLISESFTPLVIALFAAPLGVATSRRGVMGGVAGSVFIYFGHLFLHQLFLAVGESGAVPPFLGAWAANLLMAALGAWLLWHRHQNRELPSLKRLFVRRTADDAAQPGARAVAAGR